MKLTGLTTVTISPWAIREGILLRHIEDGPGWWPTLAHPEGHTTPPRPLRVATP
jgi:exopolyphosphatase/guanosine-5'-triphosphate,3'-diphosphate pyrophosphatase